MISKGKALFLALLLSSAVQADWYHDYNPASCYHDDGYHGYEGVTGCINAGWSEAGRLNIANINQAYAIAWHDVLSGNYDARVAEALFWVNMCKTQEKCSDE